MKFMEPKECACETFKPEPYSFAEEGFLTEDETDLYNIIVSELVRTIGNKWCHRDDTNPFERLYSNSKGEHHTVKEYAETVDAVEHFRERGWGATKSTNLVTEDVF